MRAILCLLPLLVAPPAMAQGPTAKRLKAPHDAVAWASAHVLDLPTDQRLHIRYFWDHRGLPQNGQALAFALNCACSHAATLVQPRLVEGTENQLWWVDLRELYPRAEDYARGHALFESMDVLEPYFHLQQAINKVEAKKQWVLQDVPGYWGKDKNGKRTWYTKKWVAVAVPELKAVAQTAVLNPNVCDPRGTGSLVALTAATRSNCPIVRLDWFVVKAMTTEHNGYYYRFSFIDDSKTVEVNGKKVRKSAQELFLANLGVDEIQVAKLQGDNRSITFRSEIAGRRMRLVELYYGGNTRPSKGVPLVSMTHDIFAEDVDPKRHALRNLMGFYNVETQEIRDRARECIGVKRNGYQTYALFNAAGDLQSRVPDNVAHDFHVPQPHEQYLQPGISCVSCHGLHDGWQPLRNDLQFMLTRNLAGRRFDFVGDLDSPLDQAATVDKLSGQFDASDQQLDIALNLARNGYADAVFRSTKYSGLRLQGLTIPVVSRVVENMFYTYMFAPIDQQTACYELGYDVSQEWAEALFNQILPILPPSSPGFSPDDPVIAGIRSGTAGRTMAVSRLEWEQQFQDAKLRVLTQESLIKEDAK